MIGIGAFASALYCALYAAYCIKNKNALAAAASILFALLPLAAFALSVILAAGSG